MVDLFADLPATSTRPRRPVIESLPKLDVRTAIRRSWLEPGTVSVTGWSDDDGFVATVEITAGGDGVDLLGLGPLEGTNAAVEFAWSQNRYGARRWWSCPNCTRRVAIVYAHGRTWECRQCVGWPHRSAVLSHRQRHLYRRQCLADRCGATVATNRIERPTGMRWRRWRRLVAQYELADAAVLADLN